MIKLKVFSSDKSLIADLNTIGKLNIPRKFIGRVFDPAVNGFVLKKEPEEIENRSEYINFVKQGDLIAADEQTANICGVNFNKRK